MLYADTVNSRLTDTPLLQTPSITVKIQPSGESYRGLTENDSRYCGITDTFVVPITDNYFVVLTVDKADTLNFSYNKFKLQSVIHYMSACIHARYCGLSLLRTPGKNLTSLLDSERRIYGNPEASSPANVFRFSISKITFPSILSHWKI